MHDLGAGRHKWGPRAGAGGGTGRERGVEMGARGLHDLFLLIIFVVVAYLPPFVFLFPIIAIVILALSSTVLVLCYSEQEDLCDLL